MSNRCLGAFCIMKDLPAISDPIRDERWREGSGVMAADHSYHLKGHAARYITCSVSRTLAWKLLGLPALTVVIFSAYLWWGTALVMIPLYPDSIMPHKQRCRQMSVLLPFDNASVHPYNATDVHPNLRSVRSL